MLGVARNISYLSGKQTGNTNIMGSLKLRSWENGSKIIGIGIVESEFKWYIIKDLFNMKEGKKQKRH